MIQEVLTDVSAEIWKDEYRIDAGGGPNLTGSQNWCIEKRTLRGGPSDGVDVVRVDNGLLSYEVLPTRGMGVWRGEIDGRRLGWDSPARFPVHPALVNQLSRSGVGWLDGFNEWICRCGLSSMGAAGTDVRQLEDGSKEETPVTLHGAIANLPAHRVTIEIDESDAGTLTVKGSVDEASLFGPKLTLHSQISTVAGSSTLALADEITNFGDESAESQLLYHINWGPPLLGAESRVVAAAKQVAPYDAHSATAIDDWRQYQGPTPGFVQYCYFIEPVADHDGTVTVLLRDGAGEFAAAISFSIDQLPYFTLWKNLAAASDGYVTGLEPGTSYPNLRSFERSQGRVLQLEPGETFRSEVEIELFTDAESISAKEAEIEELQASVQTKVHHKLHPHFNSLSS